jgi:FKBP-type peptidyl-prolyl cis-trans isomerase SlpA
VGDGSLLPGFEKVVEETAAGERRETILEASQAFGEVNEDNVQKYPHYQFPADMAIEEGLMIAFRDQAGNEQAGVVSSVDRSGVNIDFNHPLAGKNIVFSVWIIERKQVANEHD